MARSTLMMLAAFTALLIPLVLPGMVLAHERRTAAGKYQLVVGFLNEPAFAKETPVAVPKRAIGA